MSNHRYSKFWWQDWQTDHALRRCSLAAQGLWMQLLCIMHDCNPYGFLRKSDENLSENDLLELIPMATRAQLRRLMEELEKRHVFYRNEVGTIYSKRMVNDGKRSEKGTTSAERRWGKRNGSPNGPPNGSGNAQPNGRGTWSPNRSPNAIDHRSESDTEAARASPSPLGGRARALSDGEVPDPRANPETNAQILHLEARTSRAAVTQPEPKFLEGEQLAAFRAKAAVR